MFFDLLSDLDILAEIQIKLNITIKFIKKDLRLYAEVPNIEIEPGAGIMKRPMRIIMLHT